MSRSNDFLASPVLFLVLLAVVSCKKLEFEDTPIAVTLSATAERTVTDQNPRVFGCSVTLVAAAGQGDRDNFVELLTLRRTLVIEGQESGSVDAATARFGSRRLYSGNKEDASDSFSTTFPFKAGFSYTLYYRDLNLRVDSAKTTTQCG